MARRNWRSRRYILRAAALGTAASVLWSRVRRRGQGDADETPAITTWEDDTGWPEGAPASGTNFFRPGEVMVLLESTSADGAATASGGAAGWGRLHEDLDRFFGGLGFPIRREALAAGPDAQPLALERSGRQFLLQTVTLANTPAYHTHDVALVAPVLRDVVRAVDRINERAATGVAALDGRFRVVVASPNWMAMPFHY